ncbi:CocE/NonD family hydrolase [Metabacillus fastidiosus]|uniref:CocE/NonD family hydrolase n=1 Tax=Metabacillus fastidiosus TaxID=1458 RepID=UPI003D2A03E3
MSVTKLKKTIVCKRNEPVVMRDGVILYADIYRPNDTVSYPILLMRTPYNKEDAQTMNFAHPSWFAQHGYVVIVQDARGRWTSEGKFEPFVYEGPDGYDTIEWAVTLPNIIPKVGLYGFSYVGFSQLLVAQTKPPHLACIAPFMCGSKKLQSSDNGAFPLAQNLSWTLFVSQNAAVRQNDRQWQQQLAMTSLQQLYNFLPLHEVPLIKKELAPFYERWIKDEQQLPSTMDDFYENITVPALHLGGWYDIYIQQTFENFNGIRAESSSPKAREHQYLYVTPWYHMPWSRFVGEIDFGEQATNQVDELLLKWFNTWLKEEKQWSEEPVQLFITGENKWISEKQWPLPHTKLEYFYFNSKGRANSLNGTGILSEQRPKGLSDYDVYVYHPSIAVPSIGGRSGPDPVSAPMGPKNQIPIEIRNDVLVYTTEILQEDVFIVGEVIAYLYASSTAEDTDFAIKLIDVYPDGRSINIAEGLIRASAREAGGNRKPLVPNEIYHFEIKAGSAAHVFKKGHAIRVNVTSSLFPTYDRNPNSLLPKHKVTEQSFQTATQTIYHNEQYASCIALPIYKEEIN